MSTPPLSSYRITMAWDLFPGDGSIPEVETEEALQIALDCLTIRDELYLRLHPRTPMLYEASVVYQEEPPGAEDWADIPTVLKLGWGDCLPLDTKVINATTGNLTSIAKLHVGDAIVGDKGKRTTVTAVCVTRPKKMMNLSLSHGRKLSCSPEHKLVIRSGDEKVRARGARRYMSDGLRLRHPENKVVQIEAVEVDAKPTMCGDITTDTGMFYLPDADLVVSNCEDLACWRAAELRVRHGIDAHPQVSCQVQSDGSRLYHITVALPDGRTEDPSRNLGMR